MRCKDVVNTMEVGNEAISSICLRNENIIYVSSGSEVKSFDVHLAFSWKPLETYEYNKDEINQIACNFKSSLLTAADDGGKIIDISQKCLYKTLRAGHQVLSHLLLYFLFICKSNPYSNGEMNFLRDQ
ncbi:hypothetical protein CsatB_018214 [Cannabis sativa]